MVTCPWCGSNYLDFQTNCRNYGGPLPLPENTSPEAISPWPTDLPPPRPPAPPRAISKRFAWKLLAISGVGITGMVFIFLGITFGLSGIFIMIFGPVVFLLGLIFALLGSVFVVLGGFLFVFGYRRAYQVVQVLRQGHETTGHIHEIRQDLSVTIQNNHPYITSYEFEVMGQVYHGRVNSINPPIPQYFPGAPATILFLPENPQVNALYPHP